MQPTGGPQFVRFFEPVLRALAVMGGSGRAGEVVDKVAELTGATSAQLDELTESGQPRFRNQVNWARFYLVKGGLIDASQRGVWALTDDGRARLNLPWDEALQIFRAVQTQWKPEAAPDTDDKPFVDEREPETAVPSLNYADELILILRNLTPAGFESFCTRLLREAGFEEVTVTGRSGDGGIDGIGLLQVNALVSVRVLFQAKRYQGSVGPSIVRDFRGALAGRSDNGVVITTGSFTAEARREAVRDGVPPIELVDSDRIIELCRTFGVGLRPVQTYEVDRTFFQQFS